MKNADTNSFRKSELITCLADVICQTDQTLSARAFRLLRTYCSYHAPLRGACREDQATLRARNQTFSGLSEEGRLHATRFYLRGDAQRYCHPHDENFARPRCDTGSLGAALAARRADVRV